MRVTSVALCALLVAAAPASVGAQGAAPVACERRDAALSGGIGRAAVVAFTGSVYGEHVCALVANLAGDGFAATIATPAGDEPAVTAAVTAGTGATLAVGPFGVFAGPAGAADAPDAVAVGPFVVAPGGTFGTFHGDTTEVPRVVLAFAGSRVVLIRTSAVTLLDLAHALREQPDLFGSDAAERAVVLASGDAATMRVRTVDGMLGAPVATARALLIKQR